MEFTSDHRAPRDSRETDLWVAFQNGQLMVKGAGVTASLPVAGDLTELNLRQSDSTYLGQLGETHCYTADFPNAPQLPSRLSFHEFRPSLDELCSDHVNVTLRAAHIAHWRRTHRCCGRCGATLVDSDQERARRCVRCGFVVYPRISPAVIVAVVRDNKILLASEPGFSSGLHGVLAGFVEPGESLEDCVRREVREEVGIEVANVAYFGSQPWPFPDSLMLAFTAEYAGGEIRIDESEILSAGWFAPDELPRIPSRLSVARKLIDWFVDTHRPRSVATAIPIIRIWK